MLLRRFALWLCMAALPCFVLSCKPSDQARDTAASLARTAHDLHEYYAALSEVITQHEKLERLQNALLGAPLDAQDLAQLRTAQAEMEKRADLAKALADLAEAYAGLAKSDAAQQASQSAANLGIALSGIQQLLGASYAPDALQHSGALLVRLTQHHSERRMAQAMDPTIAALSDMFSQEKPVYCSINRTWIGLAQSLALELLRRNQADTSSLMLPALRPFGLASRLPEEKLSPGLEAYARQQIQEQGQTEIAAHDAASTELEQSLKEAARQVHALAAGEHSSAPPQPRSLAVEHWTELIH
jgi:hypothetical protein